MRLTLPCDHPIVLSPVNVAASVASVLCEKCGQRFEVSRERSQVTGNEWTDLVRMLPLAA